MHGHATGHNADAAAPSSSSASSFKHPRPHHHHTPSPLHHGHNDNTPRGYNGRPPLTGQQQQPSPSLDLLPLLPVPPVGSHGNNSHNSSGHGHAHLGALHVPTSPVGHGGGWSKEASVSPPTNPSSPGHPRGSHHSRSGTSSGRSAGFDQNGSGAMSSPTLLPKATAVAPGVGPNRCWVLSDNTHLLNQVLNKIRSLFFRNVQF